MVSETCSDVPVCDVCEQAPAAVTCRADAAALCHACDRDIHSANPLARRHERIPIVAFHNHHHADEYSEEEAEAASWLLQDPNARTDPNPDTGMPEYRPAEHLFKDPDPDLISGLQKQYSSADGVVPDDGCGPGQYPGPVVDGFPTYDVDYLGTKPFLYNFTNQSISHSVSSSDVGVVPDHNALVDVVKTEVLPSPLSGVDREARVLRYREKRKNRKFEKTIRYASRKAYAETRPRIKGRFAKRSELEVDSPFANDPSYGVVPTFLSSVAT